MIYPEDFPHDKFAWLKKYENIINELNTVILTITKISALLKNKGMSISTIEKSKKILCTLTDKHTKNIKEELLLYFQECFKLIPKTKKILCTSDIIESCFGKYKNNISKNSLCGITNISLFIPASICDTGIKEINTIMERAKIKMIKEWTKNNIGQSLLKKRRDAFSLNTKGTKKKNVKRA